MLAASEAVLLTSIQEGFGLPYLEAAAARRPLVIPDLTRLSARKLEDFIYRQMQIGRTLRLADGAAECLRQLNDHGILLGIASNSQAYTLRELEAALSRARV